MFMTLALPGFDAHIFSLACISPSRRAAHHKFGNSCDHASVASYPLPAAAAGPGSRLARRVHSLTSIFNVLASAVGAAAALEADSEADLDPQPLQVSPDDIAKLDTCSFGPHRCDHTSYLPVSLA